MSEAFERISQGLKEAIAHAAGEEVAGVVVHTLKPEQNATKERVAPMAQRFVNQHRKVDSYQHRKVSR